MLYKATRYYHPRIFHRKELELCGRLCRLSVGLFDMSRCAIRRAAATQAGSRCGQDRREHAGRLQVTILFSSYYSGLRTFDSRVAACFGVPLIARQTTKRGWIFHGYKIRAPAGMS